MANPETQEQIVQSFFENIDLSQFKEPQEPGVKKLKKVLKFIKRETEGLKYKAYDFDIDVKIDHVYKMEIETYNVIYAYSDSLKLRVHWSNERNTVHLTFKFYDRNIHILFKGYIEIETHDCSLVINLMPESKVVVY